MNDKPTLTPADNVDNILAADQATEAHPGNGAAGPPVPPGAPNLPPGYAPRPAPPDPAEVEAKVLTRIATLDTVADADVRQICEDIAIGGLDALAESAVLDALQERTGLTRSVLKKQLAKAKRVHAVEIERAEKLRLAANASFTGQYAYVESAAAMWSLVDPGWVSLTAFRGMWGEEGTNALLTPEAGCFERVHKATYHPFNRWLDGFRREDARYILDQRTGRKMLNLWEPSSMVPWVDVSSDDVAPWLDHLETVLRVEANDADHVLDWLAFTLQFPNVKINHMLLLGGPPGLGKDTFISPVLAALGEFNVVQIEGGQALGDFDTPDLAHCALLVLQELNIGTRNDAKRLYNGALKRLAAAPPNTLMINVKGIPQFPIPNVLNLLALTNDRSAVWIEQGDRRVCPVWCHGEVGAISDGYFVDLYRWLRHDGGCEAVVGWLLERDLSDFNSKAHPPGTDWRDELADASLTDVATMVLEFLAEWPRPLVTVADLLEPIRARAFGETRQTIGARTIAGALNALEFPCRRVNESWESARAAGRLSRRKVTVWRVRPFDGWTEIPGAMLAALTM